MNIDAANSIITIDLTKVKSNIEKIRKHIGDGVELMITAKSNCYGYGLVPPCKFMYEKCGIKIFATAMVCEAVELRQSGIDCEMMVFAGIPYQAIHYILDYDLITPAYDAGYLKLLSEQAQARNKIAKVHVAIDTGMHRLGVRPGQPLNELLNLLQTLPNIEIDGAYSHLSDADQPSQETTYKQVGLLNQAVEQIKERGIKLRYVHLANTGATVRCPESYYNLVRPASLWQGDDTSPGEPNLLKLQSAMSWSTYITNIQTVEAGEEVGYEGKYVAKRRTKIAILGVGGGDGYCRQLIKKDGTENGVVLIGGKRAKLIAVNMDQTFADITDIDNVHINDEVVLIGTQGDEELNIIELSEMANASPNHLMGIMGNRPFRVYKEY